MTTSNRPLQHLAEYSAPPAFSAFRSEDLTEILSELEAVEEIDVVDPTNLRADIAACRAAIAAEQAGAIVLAARDADGWYFAVRGPDVYRDADALTPCDCDELYRVRRHAHVEQYDCDGCGFTVVVEGEVSEAGEGIEFTAGEWRVRCPGCGVVYVLTDAAQPERYVIYRVGANADNQQATERLALGFVEAHDRWGAIEAAAARWRAWANQHFDPVPVADVSDEEYAAAQEADEEE